MDVNQIYTIVNEAATESLGEGTLQAVDAQSLISLGNVVLSSQNNTELFLNTLAQRIGKTIFSFRAYTNKNADMVMDDFQYGAILQKIKFKMPTATKDEAYTLTDGQAVDMYKVSKPRVTQKLFVTETPYQFYITIQRFMLKEAFLSESALAGFVGYIFGEVKNAIELALENLGKICLANFMAETTHEIKLVTDYNNATGSAITPATAITNEAFLRYAMATIKQYSKRLTDMSVLYNDGTETRFTPFADQRLRIISSFQTALETQVQYAAFNDEYVKLSKYTEVNYWQAADTPMSISVERASDGTATKIDNIVAALYDRDALGIYKITEDVATTPFNAAGLYYNTYWHEKQLWFNDLSENGLIFTLN